MELRVSAADLVAALQNSNDHRLDQQALRCDDDTAQVFYRRVLLCLTNVAARFRKSRWGTGKGLSQRDTDPPRKLNRLLHAKLAKLSVGV